MVKQDVFISPYYKYEILAVLRLGNKGKVKGEPWQKGQQRRRGVLGKSLFCFASPALGSSFLVFSQAPSQHIHILWKGTEFFFKTNQASIQR